MTARRNEAAEQIWALVRELRAERLSEHGITPARQPAPRSRKWPPIPLSWEEQVALETLRLLERSGWFRSPDPA
jgi:hypothetical protein